jgi:hypothetical protein
MPATAPQRLDDLKSLPPAEHKATIKSFRAAVHEARQSGWMEYELAEFIHAQTLGVRLSKRDVSMLRDTRVPLSLLSV